MVTIHKTIVSLALLLLFASVLSVQARPACKRIAPVKRVGLRVPGRTAIKPANLKHRHRTKWVWVPGHYKVVHKGRVWIPGHWRRH